ncbi:MAG TPA: ATP synthase F1 subunit epsilon [Acidobacteriaceae bacterium]|jgi:F-type H+-transporting ATPase subunit epsilon|nr:ATP synthase F1 subunit epsilon [Acidobacteriaceae bacterium]
MAEATSNQLRVRLVTPDRLLLDTTADAVDLPAKNGMIEVLYGHAPLLSELGAGELVIHNAQGSDAQHFYVAWGFVEVLPDRVTVLAESAIPPNEIDTSAAKESLERGEKMWHEAGEAVWRYEAANEVIHEAEARLAAAKDGK